MLVIDDSELVHRLLKVRLQAERLELFGALNSKDGMEMAKTLNPDVILLDIDIDELNGFDVIQKLKEDTETQGIAVIFISASGDTAQKVRALDLGAIDFIGKPFEAVELQARVRSAIRTQGLVRMLAKRAQVDGLTGLWNHTYFDLRLAAECSEARRHTRPLALIMADIDQFKMVNDQFGHLFGDRVLERFSAIFSGGRASDIACRFGGEEFSIILPNTPIREATDVAERYRVLLQNQTWAEHPGVVVTASFGVSDLASVGDTGKGSDMVSAADAALYQAKSAGRNRVVVAEARSANVRVDSGR